LPFTGKILLKKSFYITVLLFALFHTTLSSQTVERSKLLQVTGIITDDEKRPVAHVSVISHKLRRGTISELTGIFSLVSMPGDTVYIGALGYKRQQFTVPDNYSEKFYKHDIELVSDTISIEGVTIFPWRNYDEFKKELIASMPVETQQMKNMYENLASIQAAIANAQSYTVTPEAGYRLYMQQNANAAMTRNQYPVNNLLNPFAWAKFFSGVKNGLLKNQKSTQTVKTKNRSGKKK
jgi:hypothetical protein